MQVLILQTFCDEVFFDRSRRGVAPTPIRYELLRLTANLRGFLTLIEQTVLRGLNLRIDPRGIVSPGVV
jgi:hypothetical protein